MKDYVILNLFSPLVAFLFGSMVGSFLNVCIYRIPQGKSVVSPSSRCPHCQEPIRFYDNIPLLSYLFLRGKCRRCGNPISLQYPLVELLAASLSLFLYLRYSLVEYCVYFVLFASLLVVTFIDLKHQIIPNTVSLPGIGVGFLSSFVLPRITYLDSLLGIALGGGVLYGIAMGYYLITKTEGMGMGDVKLLAMIGAFLGVKIVIVTIFLSAFLGSVIGIGIILIKKKTRKYALPYGPFLTVGAFLSFLWGDALLRWYYHLLYGG